MLKMLNKKGIKRFFIRRIVRRDLPLSLVSRNYQLRAEIKTVKGFLGQGKTVPCNLNFDDLCPIYTNNGLDFGGNIEKGLSCSFKELLEDYPYLGVTIFVIPNCKIRHNALRSFSQRKDRYDISSPAHAQWLQYYTNLSRKYNIEYGMHGCYHRQFENIFFARYTEFAYKRGDESYQALSIGKDIFKRANLETFGFRQPGWDINSDLSLLDALKAVKFEYIAGSSNDAGFNASVQRVSNYYPTVISGMMNFPQNILLDWSIEKMREEIDKIIG
ncbi:DUF2334 domain-containing protein, partial [bacterium]|nr:DUF2334 domain-containing protein [bacterium]